MASWLIPVNPAIYNIEGAFDELSEISWKKNNFDFQVDDLIYLYVTEPIGKIMYLYKVTGFLDKDNYSLGNKGYWLEKVELEKYKGIYFTIKPMKKVFKETLSRHYLIKQGLISPKDTLQSHKTDKFIKEKPVENIKRHKKLLAFIAEQFSTDSKNIDYPDEANLENQLFPEGAKQTVQVNRFERSSEARTRCIEFHGTRCKICEMGFAETYGFFAKDFIHVHHITPLPEISDRYEVNPETDLIPVCPNCHAMLHRKENGMPMTVERLKQLYEVSKSSR